MEAIIFLFLGFIKGNVGFLSTSSDNSEVAKMVVGPVKALEGAGIQPGAVHEQGVDIFFCLEGLEGVDETSFTATTVKLVQMIPDPGAEDVATDDGIL